MQRQAKYKSQSLVIGRGSDEGWSPQIEPNVQCSARLSELSPLLEVRRSQSFYENDEPNGENPSLIVKYNSTLKN